MKKSIQKGFSLIELMVVIAIIAILAAVAVPMYSQYTTRAKVASAIAATGAAKAAIAEAMNEGAVPSGITMPNTGTTLASGATATTATIQLALDTVPATAGVANVAGVTVSLAATQSNGVINWACTATGGTAASQSDFPSECTYS